MAGFIQLVEYETDDIEAVEKAIIEFRNAHPEVMKFTTSRTTEDRDHPGRYISIVEFNSYEEAMEQSNNPALSEVLGGLGEKLMTNRSFRNLDVRTTI